jgi:TonB family protein
MKNLVASLVAIQILTGLTLSAQKELADNAAADESVNPEMNKETVGKINFIDKYEINTLTIRTAKILFETTLQNTLITKGTAGQVLSKGTIVHTYKYFPKEAMWAVMYNERWGFVNATAVKPIQEKTVESDQEPYDETPKLLSEIKINYPREAKSNEIYGKVFVKALISKTGSVEETEIVRSIPGLDEAAIEAVKKAKFKPGKYQGKPVQVWIRIPIDFEPE